MAVITIEQDARLANGGLKKKVTGPMDLDTTPDWERIVWYRHVAAGIDVESYRQLGAEGPNDHSAI